MLKTASTLKTFSNKIKTARDEVLTPETVKDMAMEIMEVADVAAEIAMEIAENVPAEEGMGDRDMDRDMDRDSNRMDPAQLEVANEEKDKDKDKLTAGTSRGAADVDDDDDEKKEMREQMASMKNQLNQIKIASLKEKLATKYASLFPKQMHEAKMNEILNSNQSIQILEAKVQEARNIITDKTMVKVASMSDSIYDINDTSEEVNIASYL